MEFTTKAFSPWHALVKVYEANCQGVAEVGGDTDYRVTVERINPESAEEPVAVDWWCRWTPEDNRLDVDIAESTDSGGYYEWDDDGTPLLVQACIRSVEPPTFAEFRDAVQATTGVSLSEPEVEQCPQRRVGDGE